MTCSNSARLATLATWVDRATARGLKLPIVLVAKAEVDLRHGLHTSAKAMAMRAPAGSIGNDDVQFRALEVAASSPYWLM